MELSDFNYQTILPEDLKSIQVRLSHMLTRGKDESVYLAFAYPENAKIRTTGKRVVTIFPEVCIGMISRESWRTGSTAEWAIYPSLRAGGGWRKKPIAVVAGREQACVKLLSWIADQNAKRLPSETPASKKKREYAETIFKAYMTTYDSFSSDTKEIASLFDLSMASALGIGHKLEEVGLVCLEKSEEHGGFRVSGAGINKSRGASGQYASDIWQCYETYDSIDRLQAIDLFIEKLPSLAEWAAKFIANEHTRTRVEKIDVYGRIK